MINAKTQARLKRLSMWNPPPGITRLHVVHDDGTIEVDLDCDDLQATVAFCPCCSTEGMHDLLNFAAADLLDAMERESKQPARKAEARVERQLARADSAFRAGLKRATKKGG
jgi:hypothetical protein